MERFFYSQPDRAHEAGRPQPEQDTRVQQLLGYYPHLSALLTSENKTYPPVPELTPMFASIVKDNDAQDQLSVLEELFASTGMRQKDVVTFLAGHTRFPQFTEALLSQQETYRFPLAVLLSHYTTTTFPERWKTQVRPQTLPEAMKPSLTERIPEWYLCASSENYLFQAMDDSAVTDVNGVMLVKHVGRLAGLCVMNATTTKGTFVRGNWYAPIEQDMRERIRNAHDSGTAHLSIAAGTWTLMRGLTDFAGIAASDIVNQAEDCLDSLPERLPDRISGKTRAEYSSRHEEAY